MVFAPVVFAMSFQSQSPGAVVRESLAEPVPLPASNAAGLAAPLGGGAALYRYLAMKG
jgi:hypothetical protein